ncbi:MAG: chloride channel protein [Maricaulaceae bacterium]|jgi:CIC family chloride channel protein
MQTPKQVRLIVRWLRGQRDHGDTLLWVWGLIVGIAAAYATILFRLAIQSVQFLAYGEFSEALAGPASELSNFHLFLAPVLAGGAVAALLWFGQRQGLLKEARQLGVPDVIEARAVKAGRVDFRSAVYSALTTAVALGGGGSAGREGPAVHLGAALASMWSKSLDLPAREGRTLAACGAAAAVAASFNAPIAGAVFAFEVVLGHYALRTVAPVAAASVAGALIVRAHLGAQPAFLLPEIHPASYFDFPAAAVLGLICALVAIGFMRVTLWGIERVPKLAREHDVPLWALPPFAGAVVGVIAWTRPEILGVGYEPTARALAGDYVFSTLVLLLVLKSLATAVCIACRFGGGIFSPAIYVGAMTGAAFGAVAALAFGGATAGESFFAIVGMGAVAGAVLGAPLSTTLIVFELTYNYDTAIAILVAVSVATIMTQKIMGASFFQLMIESRGYELREGPQRVILMTVRVRDFMTPIDRLKKESVLEGPSLYEDDTLGKALGFLDAEGVDGAPVKSRASGEVTGYISRADALVAYNKRLVDAHVERTR